MPKLICIGELLIDFIPNETGIELKNVTGFTKAAGGAPANVAACVSKLGIHSVMITKLGLDAFGDFLVDTLNEVHVDTTHIKRTDIANTALAFVSLKENGERDFSFYRNPSSDLLLDESEIEESLFESGDIIHFCSVDLVDAPVKKAHVRALEYAEKKGCLISFDPNLRFPLWKNLQEYYETIQSFIPYAHILKISSDELEFITRIKNTNEAIKSLFVGNVKIVIITDGGVGATLYTKSSELFVPSFKTKVVDTTGAGDAFIGGILYYILKNRLTVDTINQMNQRDALLLAHKISSIVVSKYGAIPSMPTISEI
ncbi:MAG: carbohydrate kinase [Firmicutes bacterium]|nr:carbohydrate kinase [Bacillota bacterium]